MKRRDLIPMAAIGVAGAWALTHQPKDERPKGPRTRSAVAVLDAPNYESDLAGILQRGLAECELDVRGKSVVLKPNLVEFDRNTCINTDARVVAAAVEVFERMGAASVRIAEGPGHRRDTLGIANEASYRKIIPGFERRFTDLNRDDVALVENFMGDDPMYFPKTILGADLIVSMAKMKTHHWAGATLSMKNFFGLVPGSVYGWPKNQLHYYGIHESVVALHRKFAAKSFAIVDGIVGMEGNGPIQGHPKHAGLLVLGRDLVAVDATCCRVMGLDPVKISYLTHTLTGNFASDWIDQRGELPASVRKDFALLPPFRGLRLV
jgi:uncharacterized protein (DUF362 family)